MKYSLPTLTGERNTHRTNYRKIHAVDLVKEVTIQDQKHHNGVALRVKDTSHSLYMFLDLFGLCGQ